VQSLLRLSVSDLYTEFHQITEEQVYILMQINWCSWYARSWYFVFS